VTGWSEGRRDRTRERVNLEQLLATTVENEVRITAALEADSTALAAARRYLTVLRAPGPLPPSDTLAVWSYDAFRNSLFFPMTGTYESIALTGDLALIRDDSLRAQIATYTGVLRGTSRLMEEWAGSFHRNWEELVGRATVAAVRSVDMQRDMGAVEADWRDPALERALFRQTIIARNRVMALEGLLTETRALRARLEVRLVD
jgi:hypothetical protein